MDVGKTFCAQCFGAPKLMEKVGRLTMEWFTIEGSSYGINQRKKEIPNPKTYDFQMAEQAKNVKTPEKSKLCDSRFEKSASFVCARGALKVCVCVWV